MSAKADLNWEYYACWLGAFLPVILAFVAHLRGPQAQAAPQPRKLPSLAFSQYLVDEGTPEVRPIYRANFYFQNTSHKTLTIQELRPSCGCLNPELDQKEYLPGEEGHFSIRVDPTKEKPGPREYFVDVVYQDPQPHEVRVTYKLVLPQKSVEITPKALVFYQLSDQHQETVQDVRVSDYRSRHFNILSLESTSPLVRAILVNEEEDDSGNRHHDLQVIVKGDVPSGTSRALINIQTDDPQFKLLQVPIIVSGPKPKVSSDDLPLKMEPTSLFLKADADGTVNSSIKLYDFQATPAKLWNLHLTSLEGTVEAGEPKKSTLGPLVKEREISVSLQIPENLPEQKGLLVIETDSQLQPRLEVPIVIEAP
ncbi:MAG: DUF1573 domain-containing protein [Planctomycetaceae bacterium]|nr:DUF1573 domain-containing protein [Planctomycetaceae bacterium]